MFSDTTLLLAAPPKPKPKPPVGGGGIPVGPPPKACNRWEQRVGNTCVRIPGSQSSYVAPNAGPTQPYLQSGQNLTSPLPNKPSLVNIGGKQVVALLQWNDGGLRISQNGRVITSTIKPSSTDGSKVGKSTGRNRNEIAIKYMADKVKGIDFKTALSGYENMKKNKSAIWFQIKPEGSSGDNNATIRLGVESDGRITIGRHGIKGKNNSSGGPMYTSLNAKDYKGKPLNISVKLNQSGKNVILVNGKELTLDNGKVAEFEDPPKKSTIKFGAETVKGTLFDFNSKDNNPGEFGVTYSDIGFKM